MTLNGKPFAHVWQPWYCMQSVKIDKASVARCDCYVAITCDERYYHVYKYDGSKVIDTCEVHNNNGRPVYVVPLTMLQVDSEITPAMEEAFVNKDKADYEAWKLQRRKKQ